MTNKDLLGSIRAISIESPVDIIIKQIKNLISSGEIQPGAKLPPERKLAEKFGVGRSYVREAIKKLEFYGIVRTVPQSGTKVAGLGIAALEGLIADVLVMHEDDFSSLVETRYILETQSVRLAAQRRNDNHLRVLKQAFIDYEKEVHAGNSALDQDLMFHLKIAEASQNDVLKSLMLLITPDVLKNYSNKNVCADGKANKALEEHRTILETIIAQDADKAEATMKLHLKDILISV